MVIVVRDTFLQKAKDANVPYVNEFIKLGHIIMPS
jgi:hypothetical protein